MLEKPNPSPPAGTGDVERLRAALEDAALEKHRADNLAIRCDVLEAAARKPADHKEALRLEAAGVEMRERAAALVERICGPSWIGSTNDISRQIRALDVRTQVLYPTAPGGSTGETLHIVFDGPPGPEAGRFVEVETPDGKSVSVGSWHDRADGFVELRIPRAASTPEGLDREAVARERDYLRGRVYLYLGGNPTIESPEDRVSWLHGGLNEIDRRLAGLVDRCLALRPTPTGDGDVAEATPENEQHIRSLQSVGRRYDAEGICRKSIDAAIAALQTADWLTALGSDPKDAAARAFYEATVAACDDRMRVLKHELRDARAALAASKTQGGGWSDPQPIETVPEGVEVIAYGGASVMGTPWSGSRIIVVEDRADLYRPDGSLRRLSPTSYRLAPPAPPPATNVGA